MSSYNYMENVPVKIAENYKPPPRVYQLPQAIAHKLQLPNEHYQTVPQYAYDFQLERKVLSKIPEWQRMRQQARAARQERKEKREQQRLRELEAAQKQLLGAVSYPNAEELSSDSDSEACDNEKINYDDNAAQIQLQKQTANASQETEATMARQNNDKKTLVTTQMNSFHNILQPTILTQRNNTGGNVMCVGAVNMMTGYNATVSITKTAGNVSNTAGKYNSNANAFNYKDFEDDTSSPFDNIELKTINDLDILAQVLHNTQLESELHETKVEAAQHETVESNAHIESNNANVDTTITTASSTADSVSNVVNLKILENTKAALDKIDFNDLSQQLQNENIPYNSVSGVENVCGVATTHTFGNNYAYAMPAYVPFTQHQQQQQPVYACFNNIYNNSEQQQQRYLQQEQHYGSNYNNQNYLYANGSTTATYAPHCNVNQHYLNEAAAINTPPTLGSATETGVAAVKSKSVPDILKELSDEVHNSEMRRRARNYSYNLQADNFVTEALSESEAEAHMPNNVNAVAPTAERTLKSALKQTEALHYFKLESATQKLAKTISSMGFPLERVAKIAQIFGADDKKIIEHLIPLSELIDLGFDETKISEALMKFDNNKEKALDYLIS